MFKQRNIEVHARSIFLQGLLLSDYGTIHQYFQPTQPKLRLIDRMCKENNMSKLGLVFSQLSSIKKINAVVFGVTSLREFEEVFKIFGRKRLARLEIEFNRFAVTDEKFINPTYWPDVL